MKVKGAPQSPIVSVLMVDVALIRKESVLNLMFSFMEVGCLVANVTSVRNASI